MTLSIRGLRSFTARATPQEPFRWCCTIATTQRTRIKAPKNWEQLILDHHNSAKYQKPAPTRSSRISKRWMEYQGMKNWEGLLDPLDDDLRDEIIRYGNFVEAAYQSFDFDPTSPGYATCRYSKNSVLARSGVPKTGYRVTKNLRAMSGIRVPRWIEKAPSWMRVESSWIGYVAVCQDKDEISRLGRRDVVIALRGTATCLEWLENLQATLSHCPFHGKRLDGCFSDHPMVESGFLSLYTSSTATCPSLQHLVREEITRILRMYGDEPLSITITGHSLGAALAILAAYDIKTTIKHAPHVTVISFGGPRVGNRSFRRHFEKQGTKVLRIVNSDDLITKVPGFIIEDHDDVPQKQGVGTARLSTWIRKRVKDTQWVYADVGHELRLSSRDSPHLKNINVATCHDLKTYLHLVNGFVSSTCPFRASARRFLHKTTS